MELHIRIRQFEPGEVFAPDGRSAGSLSNALPGSPYALCYLIREAFEDIDSGEGYAEIPASILRKRLPAALEIAGREVRLACGKEDPRATARYRQALRAIATASERAERETGMPLSIAVFL